jgi:glutamine synthetase
MTAVRQAEYVWLDGASPTQRLRSKTRIVAFPENEPVTLEAFPTWSFDGSSTYQAAGHDSDLILKPVTFVRDPLRGAGPFLVLCEVMGPDGTPHAARRPFLSSRKPALLNRLTRPPRSRPSSALPQG